MNVKKRYDLDPAFKKIIDGVADSIGKTNDEVLDAVRDMEVGLKRLMSSSDNRNIYLKYIGQFTVTYNSLRRKLLYFIRLYRKGFIRTEDKGIIGKTYRDLKKKNIERIKRKKERNGY